MWLCLLLMLCGVNFPVSRLPEWLQMISLLLPMTRGVQAARLALVGAPVGQILPLLVGEILVGLVYVLAGYLVFRWFEEFARRGGLQEAY